MSSVNPMSYHYKSKLVNFYYFQYETIVYYLKNLNCPPNKLVMGIPFYGASYTLTTNSATTPKFGGPVKAAGKPGPYTAAAATISYMEVLLCVLSSHIYLELAILLFQQR